MQSRQPRGVCAYSVSLDTLFHLVPLVWSKGEIREVFLEEVTSEPNLEG